MTPSLSLTFEPPSTTVYGLAGSRVSFSSTPSSVSTSRPAADGSSFRQLVHARLLAVHDTEAVGDEGVAELRQLRGELLAVVVILRRLVRRRTAGSRAGRPGPVRARAPRRAPRRRRCQPAKATGAPSSSPSRVATGARLYFASGLPSGRPRCEIAIDLRTRAGQLLDGADRRADAPVIGDRAVDRAERSGRSARSPACRAGSPATRGCAEPSRLLQALGDVLGEVDQPVGVAPLVVVPGRRSSPGRRARARARRRRSTSAGCRRCRARRSRLRCTPGCP